MSEIDLVDTQINILLNLMYLDGKRGFSVHSPLLGADLFDVGLGRRDWTCVPSLDRGGFKDKVVEARKKVPAQLEDEVPGYDSLRNVIMASGAFSDEDFGERYMGFLKKIRGNVGKYTICLDTNVLYNRFVSSNLIDTLSEMFHPPEIVLSRMVVNEVRKKSNERYEDVSDLVCCGEEFDRFRGVYKLRSRKAKIALSELDFIDEKMRTVHVGDEDFVDDNEERDLLIVKEYEGSVGVTGKKGCLLGFEYNFHRKVEGTGVDFVFLGYPRDLMDVEIGHGGLYKLLRYTAQVFGCVRLKGLGCCMYGVWEGVDDSEFEKGKVKVVFDGEMLDGLEEEVSVSSGLREVL